MNWIALAKTVSVVAIVVVLFTVFVYCVKYYANVVIGVGILAAMILAVGMVGGIIHDVYKGFNK